jgi:predicted Rossmann fold flavoprotein
MFPTSNSSQTIIDLFIRETERLGIQVLRHSAVVDFQPNPGNDNEYGWQVKTIKATYAAKKVLVATGSNPKIWGLLELLGHTIDPPVPSLFTFNIKDERIDGIPGVSTEAQIEILAKRVINPKITIQLKSQKGDQVLMSSQGPTLVTHWGLSGPAILKLSAWGAKLLNEFNYSFKIRVNWLPEYHKGSVLPYLLEIKEMESKKTVLRTKAIAVPRRLWTNLVRAAGIDGEIKWASVNKLQLQQLADQLTQCEFQVEGRSAFKEEFVTAGGVDLKEINFKTYESKLLPNLFFAGEVINVDAITGGFNFQNAWTSAYIAAQAIAID